MMRLAMTGMLCFVLAGTGQFSRADDEADLDAVLNSDGGTKGADGANGTTDQKAEPPKADAAKPAAAADKPAKPAAKPAAKKAAPVKKAANPAKPMDTSAPSTPSEIIADRMGKTCPGLDKAQKDQIEGWADKTFKDALGSGSCGIQLFVEYEQNRRDWDPNNKDCKACDHKSGTHMVADADFHAKVQSLTDLWTKKEDGYQDKMKAIVDGWVKDHPNTHYQWDHLKKNMKTQSTKEKPAGDKPAKGKKPKTKAGKPSKPDADDNQQDDQTSLPDNQTDAGYAHDKGDCPYCDHKKDSPLGDAGSRSVGEVQDVTNRVLPSETASGGELGGGLFGGISSSNLMWGLGGGLLGGFLGYMWGKNSNNNNNYSPFFTPWGWNNPYVSQPFGYNNYWNQFGPNGTLRASYTPNGYGIPASYPLMGGSSLFGGGYAGTGIMGGYNNGGYYNAAPVYGGGYGYPGAGGGCVNCLLGGGGGYGGGYGAPAILPYIH